MAEISGGYMIGSLGRLRIAASLACSVRNLALRMAAGEDLTEADSDNYRGIPMRVDLPTVQAHHYGYPTS